MLYGKVCIGSLPTYDNTLLNRLRKTISWEEAEHHTVSYEGFSGGVFLDPRLPFTVDDCVYIDESTGLLVLISGCIYNIHELNEKHSLTLNRLSISAFIAHAYLEQGPAFVKDLIGDFSIAIYHHSIETLYLFRDQVGIVPLSYTITENEIYFSTDIISLCRVFHATYLNIEPLLSGLKLVDMTVTPNDRVLKVMPGHMVKYTCNDIAIESYWALEHIKTDWSLTQEQLFSELKVLLNNAVHIRSDQRFRAAAHVSGGLDSSLIGVLARREYPMQEEFFGFSWSPSNHKLKNTTELDERDLVIEVCDQADIKPAFLSIEVDDFISLAQNSINNFMSFYEAKVLAMANAGKINLLFSGWGGDEFFSFGSIGVDLDLVVNFQWKTFLKKNPLNQPKKILEYLVYRVFMPLVSWTSHKDKKDYDDDVNYLKKEYRKVHKPTYERYYYYRSRRAFQLGIFTNYHLAERTECWYIMGYKSGVVYRYPLLDVRIIEYMLKVPSKLLILDDKYTRIVPRVISEGILPESIRWKLGKTDPAFFDWADQKIIEIGKLLIKEIDDFRLNPNLCFIDFGMLEKDIKEFKDDKLEPHKKVVKLFSAIEQFKSLHEFTKSYERITE